MRFVSLDHERPIQKDLLAFDQRNLVTLPNFLNIPGVPFETFALG